MGEVCWARANCPRWRPPGLNTVFLPWPRSPLSPREPVSPPTPADVASQLLALRQDAGVSAARVRDYYALLHLPVVLQAENSESRANLFVDFLRWTLDSLDLDPETAIIAKWSLFPTRDIAKVVERHEQARAEIRAEVAPRPGEVVRDYSIKMVSDRERSFLGQLSHHLVDSKRAEEFLDARGLTPIPRPPRDPFDGTNLRWHEWRVVLNRRADPVKQYCYYNVLMQAARDRARFFDVAYTSGEEEEPEHPIRLISERAGHELLTPVRDDKPLMRSRTFIDAVYFGRTLAAGDWERVKYCRTLYKDVGKESWVAHRSISGSPHKLDMRILLDPKEPLRKWRKEIWSDQSTDARLLYEREYLVRGNPPRLVHWFKADAQPGQLHRLMIVP